METLYLEKVKDRIACKNDLPILILNKAHDCRRQRKYRIDRFVSTFSAGNKSVCRWQSSKWSLLPSQ